MPCNIITNVHLEPKLPTVEHFKPLSAWNCWVFFSVEACQKSPVKNVKSTRGVHFTIFPASLCTAEFFAIWHTRSIHRHNHMCQIFSQSVQGLRSSDTPKLSFPIDLLRRPYNSVRTAVRVRHCDHITKTAKRSCARVDTICPRPSPPTVGAPAPRAPPSRRNVAVFPTPNTFPRWPLQPPYALRPRWVKRPGDLDLLTLDVVSESRVTWTISVPILVFLGPMYATNRRQTSDRRQTKASLNAPTY